MSGATWVFIPLAVLALVVAVVAIGRLFSGAHDVDGAVALGDPDRDARRLALEGEKARIFGQLKDLDHEYGLGKLSDDDYRGLKQHFESEAIRILDALERA
jgi:hypothetical protein